MTLSNQNEEKTAALSFLRLKDSCKPLVIKVIKAIFSTVDIGFDLLQIKKTVPDQVTCMDGTVNMEPISGMVTYDDTHQVICKFGRTQCYKQTMNLMIGQWPGKQIP